MADETTSVKLEADSKAFIRAFNEASEAVGNLKGGILSMVHGVDYAKSHMENYVQSTIKGWTQIGTAAAAAGAITLGTIGMATNSFAKFEEQMANVSTVMTDSTRSVERMGESVMNLTSEIPQSAEELAVGLYAVNSAGYQAEEAMKVLDATARYSTAALTDMQSSVNAVTGILHAYNLNADDAAMVTDVLFKAVEVGQMTGAEFTQQIGDWAAMASIMGVSFQSAAAAMSVLTTTGALPAAQAATSLASILRVLMKPTEEMTKAFQKLGVSSGREAIEAWGLADTLQRLWDVAGQSETVWAQMMGDQEAIKGSLTLIGKGYEDLVTYQEMFNDEARTSGTVQRAFAKQMDTVNNQLALMRNEFRQMGYYMGLVVGPWVKVLLKTVNAVLRAVNDLPTPIRRFVAYVQLAVPIMSGLAMLGGAILLNSIKTIAAVHALTKMAGVAKAVHLFGLASSLEKIATFIKGGVLKNTAKYIAQIVHLNGASAAAFFKNAAATLASVASYAALAVAIYLVYRAWGDAGKKADEFYNSIGDSSRLTTINTLTAALEKVRAKMQEVNYVVDDSLLGKGWDAVKGTFQLITPFTENTVVNDIAMYKKGKEEAASYQRQIYALFIANAEAQRLGAPGMTDRKLAAASRGDLDTMKRLNIEMQSLTISAIEAAQAAGEFDWETYQTAAEKLNDLQQARLALQRRFGSDFKPSDEMIKKEEEYQAAFDQMNEILGRYTKEIYEKDVAEHAATASTSRLELAMLKFKDAASTASDKLEAYNTILNETIGANVKIADAESKVASTFQDLGAAMRDNGANFDLLTTKGQALQAAISMANTALQDMMAVSYEMTGSTQAGDAAREAYAQGLIKMAKEANFTTDEIEQLLTMMGYTPSEIKTSIELSGDQEAMKELIALKLFMAAMDGYTVKMRIWIETVQSGGAPGAFPQMPTMDDARTQADKIIGMMATAAKTAGGGGGGASGGAGSRGWRPSATQLANMKRVLASPIVNMLQGELGAAWQKQTFNKWLDSVTANIMIQGNTRVGAGILSAAQKSKTDPADDIASYVEAYNRLVKASGKAAADIAVNQFDTLEDFQMYVDTIESLLSHQQDVEDWKYSNELVGFEEYKALLEQRLSKYEEYSDEWMSLTDQISSVEREQLDEERRLAYVKMKIGEMSKEEYKSILMGQLADAELYSQEWYDLWQEINSITEESTNQLSNNEDAVKRFADAVKSAFEDIKRSVEDPMLSATSMVAAFGEQTSVTMDQVQGFYSHMMEGTTRWVDTIRALKAQGINGEFLKQLIQAGPQSLGFAESILALGGDGIGFINQSMSDIANMASGLGFDIAQGQVGPVTNVDQSITVQVGDVSIVGEMPDGVTLTQVQQAITDALNSVANNIANHQPA